MRYKFILLSVIVTGLFHVSCNDWLDVQPEMQQKEDDMFTTYKGFRNALTGCYMAMCSYDIYGEKLTISNIEALASLWEIKEQSGLNYFLTNHDYNDEARQAMQTIYSKLFNVIVQANKIIAHAETTPEAFPNEASRSVILGEAYAIRAYCQLDVLRLFGEVPNGNGEKVSLPYSEVKAFDERAARYDFTSYSEKLISDLKRAEQLMKDNDPLFKYTFGFLSTPAYFEKEFEDTYMSYRQSRLNYWAVKALQARAYLYMGRTKDAYDAAKAVIDAKDKDDNPVMTLTGVTDRGQKRLACPGECLFYLSKHNIKTTASILAGGSKSIEKSKLFITEKRLNSDLFPNDKDIDIRYLAGWNKGVECNGLNETCATIKKYYFDDNVQDASLYYEIIPMLRMSEVYLIAIETTPDLTEANKLYADYMLDGCGILLNGDIFNAQTHRIDILLQEYRREFFAEGQMFYTYKRIGAGTMLWYDREITDKDYVLWNCVNTEFNP